MKNVLLSMAVLSSLVFAAGPQSGMKPQGEMGQNRDAMFQQHKTEMLQSIEANHQARMQCLKAAQNREAMKECHEKMKEQRMDRKEDMKEKRSDMKEQRMEKRQDMKEQKMNMREGKPAQPMQPVQPIKQ